MILNADELLADALATSKEIRMHHEIFESLFTFARRAPTDKSRWESLDKGLLISIFRDNYRRYLRMHVVPKMQKMFGDGPVPETPSWHLTFIECVKSLNDLILHFNSFWGEVGLDRLTLQQVKADIRDAIVYEVLPQVGFEGHLQSYLALVFSQYYRSAREDFETQEATFRSPDTFELVCRMMGEATDPADSTRFFDLQTVYAALVSLQGTEEAFKRGVYTFLSQKICDFLKTFDFHRKNLVSFNDLLSCYFSIFVQRFLERLALDIRGETRPLRSNKREPDLVTPGNSGHNRFKNNSFQKQPNRVNLEVIHTEDSHPSLQSPGAIPSGQSGTDWGVRNPDRPVEGGHQSTRTSGDFTPASFYGPLSFLLHNEFLKRSQGYLFHAIQNQERNAAFIDDLGKSLAVTQASDQLIADLDAQVKKNLIRNSNSTQALLKFYIDLLSFWDKLRLDYTFLQHLIGPLKAYIVSRTDSLRVIITMLMEELNKKRAAKSAASARDFGSAPEVDDRMDLTDDDRSEELGADFHRKTTGFAALKDKKMDIRVLLADLYGSKERFFAEYESFVAEKILYFEEVNIDDEQSNVNFLVNHLKVANDQQRFGIIVGDLFNSRRWTDGFHERARHADQIYDFVVISEAFWPIKKEFESFKLGNTDAEKVQNQFNEYFKEAKKQSLVKFHNTLGFLELDFELNRRTLTYRGPPIFGVVLLMFTDPVAFDQGIPASQVETRLEYDPQLSAQAIGYWINNEIIVEEKPTQIIAEDEYGLEPEPLYRMNKSYAGDKTVFEYLEKDNPMIQSESDQGELNTKPLYFQLRLQKLILSIMNSRNGSCQRDHLLDLIKSIYKSDLQTNLIDQHFEVCLQKLVKRKALVKKGDVYYSG